MQASQKACYFFALCGPLAQLVRATGSEPVGPGFESLMVHHIFLSRGIAQLVEQRSPKPRAEGSSPSAPAKSKTVTER